MEAPELKKLARWSLKQGVATNGIEPYLFEHSGRGFRARTNVTPAKLLLSVPKSMLMNHVTALKHAGLRVLAEDGAQFPPEVVLSLHLLIEKKLGEKSRFRAFIGSLPSYYTTPYYWGIEAKEMIRARSFDYKAELAVVEATKSAVAAMYVRVVEALLKYANDFPEFQTGLTEIEFAWAWSTVMTRSMFIDIVYRHPQEARGGGVGGTEDEDAYLPFTDLRPCYTLVPLADLFNHSNDAKIDAKYNFKTSCYEFHVAESIPSNSIVKGDEVCICYGHHSNWKLLTQYGFALENNSADCVKLSLPELAQECEPSMFPLDATQVKHVKETLQVHNLSSRPYHLVHIDGPSWGLVATLRILHGGKTQDEIHKSALLALQDIPLADLKREEAVWKSLVRVCRRRLSSLEDEGAKCIGDAHVGMVDSSPARMHRDQAQEVLNAIRVYTDGKNRILRSILSFAERRAGQFLPSGIK